MTRRVIFKLTRRAAVFAGLAFIILPPPSGLTQKDSAPNELRALVETERAFSRASTERGMKDAFIEYAAPGQRWRIVLDITNPVKDK